MRKACLLVLTVVLVFACGGKETTTQEQQVTHATQPNGEKIYKLHCVICHGRRGDMMASGAFDLTKSTLSQEERVAIITNGRKTMAAFKNKLSPEQIEAVATYTGTLQKAD